ncbi:MAG: ATP-binding protein, partial [Verrucomicrobiales bacterium]|nr:ATP-binding protein [Verrucomicrobiales bacterium]
SSPDGKKWTTNNEAKLAIKITPPWYNNWWFRLVTTMALIIGGFFIVRSVYQNRIRAIERRESKISAERDKAEVALARQLQHAVLLERTSRGLNQSGREDEIFSSPLKNLADHFEVDHGLIYRITDLAENKYGVKLIANHSADGKPALPPLKLEFLDPSIQQALRSESSFAVSPPRVIATFLNSIESPPLIRSVLFVSTRYLNRPNGVIVLLSGRATEEWGEDEIKLINALSPQFGMSIAQMSLAEKEQHYLIHLEEARHQAEVANRAKSDFLAKMTHELRTPLNSIIGFTEILQEDHTLLPKQRELVEIVNNSGDHLLDVINDILDLSKIEAGKIERSDETFDLLPLLKSVYEMLGMKAKAKKIGFEFAARTALPDKIHTDRSKIRQTLINLLGNAIKFTDQGAVSLAVSAAAYGEPVEENGMMKRKVRLSFEVADTGKGISSEEVPKLFEKYGQTESGRRSTEGTGLGLPIARSFIQLLGGDIVVESEYGRGTVFKFYFECEEVAALEAESAASSITERSAQKISGITSSYTEKVRILIAEDQPNNRLLLRKILGRAGFELQEASNGKEAVELSNAWHPHLILMDEDMPIMKGSEATREIVLHANGNEPVIVSLTAYALEQAKQSAIEAGCKDFVAKPFKAHEIFSVISRHLDLEYTFEDAA